MTSVSDFATRDRANTGATQSVPLSTMSHDNPPIERRGSIGSALSARTSNDLRYKHPARSNTVKTYREPEQEEPGWQPGAEPGIDTSEEGDEVPAEVKNIKAKCDINIVDFSDIDVRHLQANNESLAQALVDPRPDDMPCRWISVNGLSWDVIKCLGNKFNLHRLAIEDIIRTKSRTKVDWYADHACIILTLQKLVRLHQDHDEDVDDHSHRKQPQGNWWQRWNRPKNQSELPYYLDKDGDGQIDEFVNAHSSTSTEAPIKQVRTLHRYENAQIPEHTEFMEKHSTLAAEDLAVSVEQVSIFLMANNTVISFFEHSAEDVEEPIRKRLDSMATMLRRSCDGSLLCQAIIDAIVDLAVPVKDAYNKARKELQVDAMVNPNIKTSRSLHIFGEEIDMLQNLFKPIVHLVNALRDHNSEPLTTASMMTPVSDRSTPLKHEKTDRDRAGAPTYNRKPSDFRKVSTLQRTNTATSVSITPLAHTYFGDVLDHCLTIIQALEQMDASASNISTLIFNTVGAKTNNFMMIFTVVTVLFAPLTFISGYFGQNFSNGAGLDHGFAFFWVISMPVMVVFTLLIFVTMLWSSIKDWIAKRGLRIHRNRRNKARLAKDGRRS